MTVEEIDAFGLMTERCFNAEEAAETYHAAWQDAAVYWKDERDELREQVARLEKERDEAVEASKRSDRLDRIEFWLEQNRRINADMGKALGEMQFVQMEREDWRREASRLCAALEMYGRHEEGCARAGLEFKLREEDYPCTCGLAAALAGSSKPTAVVISPPP